MSSSERFDVNWREFSVGTRKFSKIFWEFSVLAIKNFTPSGNLIFFIFLSRNTQFESEVQRTNVPSNQKQINSTGSIRFSKHHFTLSYNFLPGAKFFALRSIVTCASELRVYFNINILSGYRVSVWEKMAMHVLSNQVVHMFPCQVTELTFHWAKMQTYFHDQCTLRDRCHKSFL